jgi:hypothetical protein
MTRPPRLLLALLLLLLIPGLAAAASPLEPPLHWQQLSPFPRSANLVDLAYGNGIFVAVDHRGNIASSPDGLAWTEHATGLQRPLTAVTWGNGQFVALTWGGVLTSADGRNWTIHPSENTSNATDLVWGDGRYVSVGRGGWVSTSTDGTTWRAVYSGTSADLESVAYGNSRYVAVGSGGAVFTSADGMKWLKGVSGTEANLYSVAYGGGQFLAAGSSAASGIVAASVDGLQWTIQTFPGDLQRTAGLHRVVWGAHGWVISGSSGLYTSADGRNWTLHTGPDIDLVGASLAAGGGRYVAGGWRGHVIVSIDGATWEAAPSTFTPSLQRVAYGGGRFVVVGEGEGAHGLIMTSADGRTWQTQLEVRVGGLSDVAYGAGRFVAVGGGLITSVDGQRWTLGLPALEGRRWRGVAYGNGRFVVVGGSNQVLVSTDGVGWNSHVLPGRDMWASGVAYGNGLFVAYGRSDGLWISTDGARWDRIAMPDGAASIATMAFGDDRWVAFGWGDNGKGLALAGTDLDTLQPALLDRWQYYVPDGLTWSDGVFLAVGGYGPLLASADGLTWEAWYHAGEELDGVARGGGQTITFNRQGDFWVTVDSPPVDLLRSDMWVPIKRAKADGKDWGVITVRLFDRNGHPLAGRQVVLQAENGQSTVIPLQMVTGADGVARFEVYSTQAGAVTYRAVLPDDQTTLLYTGTVTFTP